MRRKEIPLHAGELGDAGLLVKFMNIEQPPKAHLFNAHRDDHYIFFLQQKGNTHIVIDFNSIILKDSCLFIIRPGQVHYYLKQKMVGWFLAVSTNVIEKYFRDYLDKSVSQFVFIEDTHKPATILKLLHKASRSSEQSNFKTKEMQAYVNAFVAIVCSSFSNQEEKNVKPQSRSQEITISFKQLLKENLSTLKKPADYAKLLHISPSYLNETLAKSTGFSTSYWIQQELFLEAKRLLCHTELSSKEIAFELGFEDHTYFARMFRKVNGVTPIGFRKAYRDLSN